MAFVGCVYGFLLIIALVTMLRHGQQYFYAGTQSVKDERIRNHRNRQSEWYRDQIRRMKYAAENISL